MSYLRWLTTVNQLFRQCFNCKSISKPTVYNFFTKEAYTTMWFAIKQRTSFVSGSKKVFKTIELTRILSKEVQDIVKPPVILRNAYFVLVENILVIMSPDERPAIKELTWR